MDKQNRIVKAVAKLPMSDRKEIARRIIEQIDLDSTWADASDRAQQLIPLAARAIGCDYLPDQRRITDVMVRQFVAAQMEQDGYSHTAIGQALGRDHSTVTQMLRSMDALLDGFYGQEAISQYKMFRVLIFDL